MVAHEVYALIANETVQNVCVVCNPLPWLRPHILPVPLC